MSRGDIMNVSITRDELLELFGEYNLSKIKYSEDIGITINKFNALVTDKRVNMGMLINSMDILDNVRCIIIEGTEGAGKSTICNSPSLLNRYVLDPLIMDDYITVEDAKNIKRVKFPRVDSLYGRYFYQFLHLLKKATYDEELNIRSVMIGMACLDRLDWILYETNEHDVWLMDRSHLSNLISHGYMKDPGLQMYMKMIYSFEESIFKDHSIKFIRDITYDIYDKAYVDEELAIKRIRKSNNARDNQTHLDRLFIEQNNIIKEHIEECKHSPRYQVIHDKAFVVISPKNCNGYCRRD